MLNCLRHKIKGVELNLVALESESVSCSGMSDPETPWTVARQAPRPWDSPGKNTGVGNCSLLQGIFLTQGSNLGLLHCRQILHYLSHQGSPWWTLKAFKCLKFTVSLRNLSPLSFISL